MWSSAEGLLTIPFARAILPYKLKTDTIVSSAFISVARSSALIPAFSEPKKLSAYSLTIALKSVFPSNFIPIASRSKRGTTVSASHITLSSALYTSIEYIFDAFASSSRFPISARNVSFSK